ncbi:MarR family winged helix-turn-helix transcriptional regulator [Mesorhizobium sp. M0085]|uniref:MarR family winged helix-turn-helix transcriptional regulator n=1 Tax=Mesorhizobium sp. M0085 TaxID=2956872 RepID=UPI003335F0CE
MATPHIEAGPPCNRYASRLKLPHCHSYNILGHICRLEYETILAYIFISEYGVDMPDIDPAHRTRLLRLKDAIASLHGLSLDHLVSLLTIAAEPGLSVNELAEKTNTPQASASRYVAVLAGRYQSDAAEPPIALITQEIRADDPRRRALFLTSEGHHAIMAIINTEVPITGDEGEAA